MRKPIAKDIKGTSGSAGYPEVERLIDSEDFDEVNRTFTAAYDKLTELGSKKRGLKKSRDATRAMQALELTMDLFRELLAIKYDLKERLTHQAQSK